MWPVRRSLAVLLVLLLALVAASMGGAALADRGDPKERFNRADQARAKSMLLRASDLAGFTARPGGSSDTDFYCRALDESDLTVTGKAESPQFTAGAAFVTSQAYVYARVADSNASWRRGTSAAGQRCLREGLRRELSGTNIKLVSFGKLSFPRLGPRSVAFRVVAAQQGVRIYLDLLAVQNGRAQAAVVLGSGLTPPPRATEVRFGRLVAARMAKAMRGA